MSLLHQPWVSLPPMCPVAPVTRMIWGGPSLLGCMPNDPPDGSSEYPRMGKAGPYSRGPVQM